MTGARARRPLAGFEAMCGRLSIPGGRKQLMWFVYILRCRNGHLYTGITRDLKRRFKEHASGRGGHYTRAFGADRFVHSERLADKSSALKREAQIKSWTRREKTDLIKGRPRAVRKG